MSKIKERLNQFHYGQMSQALVNAVISFESSLIIPENRWDRAILVEQVRKFLSDKLLTDQVKKDSFNGTKRLTIFYGRLKLGHMYSEADNTIEFPKILTDLTTSLDTWHIKKPATPLFDMLQKLTGENFKPRSQQNEKVTDSIDNPLKIKIRYQESDDAVIIGIVRRNDVLTVSFSPSNPLTLGMQYGLFEKEFTPTELQDLTSTTIQVIANGVNKLTAR